MKVLEKFAGLKRHNYCEVPKLDVDILPDVYLCEKCGEPVQYDPKGGNYGLGRWAHVDPDAGEHYCGPRVRCRYCHSQDAKFRQHPWHDAVECDRCGGIDGRAIGD